MSLARRALPLALVLAIPAPAPSWAACAERGTGCPAVPIRASLAMASPGPTSPAVGDVLERGAHSILLNAGYYGLPPVSDGWVYVRVGREVFRVDWRSHEVLARVTDEVAPNF